MTNQKKLKLLEEMLDIEEGSLNEEMKLTDVENWDSMASIALIALVDDKFHKQLTASTIKQFKTVRDILNIME